MNKELEEARRGGEVIPFQPALATAPTGTGEDWLRNLPDETRFTARTRNYKGPWLQAFGISAKYPLCILVAIFEKGSMDMVFVDSQKFSRDYELVEIIPEPTIKEKQEDG